MVILYFYNQKFSGEEMTLIEAVKTRINELLVEKNMTLYALECKSGILHGTMMCLMNGRSKNITLKTLMMISEGFGITVAEFLKEEYFSYDKIALE